MVKTLLVLVTIGVQLAFAAILTKGCEEVIVELSPMRIIQECTEAIATFTEDFLDHGNKSIESKSDSMELMTVIREMEWSCSNVSRLLREYDNRTNDHCSHVYSKIYRDFRLVNLNTRKENLCNQYGNSIANFTEDCNRIAKGEQQLKCVLGKSESLKNNANLRRSYILITAQRGNIQTISRDLFEKDQSNVCCALANITKCIEELYEEKCKPLSESKREDLKKMALSRIKKDQNAFNCKLRTLKVCSGMDEIKVYRYLFFTFIIVIFCQYI